MTWAISNTNTSFFEIVSPQTLHETFMKRSS